MSVITNNYLYNCFYIRLDLLKYKVEQNLNISGE